MKAGVTLGCLCSTQAERESQQMSAAGEGVEGGGGGGMGRASKPHQPDSAANPYRSHPNTPQAAHTLSRSPAGGHPTHSIVHSRSGIRNVPLQGRKTSFIVLFYRLTC